MTTRSPEFSGYAQGQNFSGGVFTSNNSFTEPGYFTEENAIQYSVNDTITYNFNSGGTVDVVYLGYYLGGDGKQYIFGQSGANYFLFGQSASQNYTITSAPYTQGSTVCYCSGTLIRTIDGDVAVEDLAIGDIVVTASGRQRPIRWLGHRTMDLRGHPRPAEARPIRIAAHALGDDRPARDLRVSPGHTICINVLGEVLIPAGALVNGCTIVQEAVETVTYWHVELDSHDILLAENLPAESYLDCGNRGFFSESVVVDLAARPDGQPALAASAGFCRPFHGSGGLVDVVRSRLRVRAEGRGWRLVQPDTWADVHLEVDGAVLRPKTRGLSACFDLPAGAREVWLVSPTSVPNQVGAGADVRALGLCVAGLGLDDGLTDTPAVALDDSRLGEGFHVPSPGHRWTAGRARIPASLWADRTGTMFLRLDLACPPLPHWVAPATGTRGSVVAA